MTESATIEIAGRTIGPGHPAYIIAELSANHHQSFDQAVAVVRAAKDAGADALKLQTYTPDTITIDSDKPPFIVQGTIWQNRKLHDLYAEAYTPWEWQPKLKEIAAELGLDLFSSAFDATSVEFLQEMDMPAYKIASFENVDIPLLRTVARVGKPVIMSTGMATLAEIEEAVAALRSAGAHDIALLKCTSAYPAPPEEANLLTIRDLVHRFGVPVGLSDHTMGVSVPVVAVSLGACIIEKHLTLSRSDSGPDSVFSLEPQEFAEMVRAVRTAETALGEARYGPSERELPSLAFRRSLFVVRDMEAGEKFTPETIRSIRPGHGLHTRYYDEIIGAAAAKPIERGTPMSWDLVAGAHPAERDGERAT